MIVRSDSRSVARSRTRWGAPTEMDERLAVNVPVSGVVARLYAGPAGVKGCSA